MNDSKQRGSNRVVLRDECALCSKQAKENHYNYMSANQCDIPNCHCRRYSAADAGLFQIPLQPPKLSSLKKSNNLIVRKPKQPEKVKFSDGAPQNELKETKNRVMFRSNLLDSSSNPSLPILEPILNPKHFKTFKYDPNPRVDSIQHQDMRHSKTLDTIESERNCPHRSKSAHCVNDMFAIGLDRNEAANEKTFSSLNRARLEKK